MLTSRGFSHSLLSLSNPLCILLISAFISFCVYGFYRFSLTKSEKEKKAEQQQQQQQNTITSHSGGQERRKNNKQASRAG